MSGYRRDFSMSNNAYESYHNGEMPLSKWTKNAILRELQKISIEYDLKIDVKGLQRLKKSQLMRCLECSSWHHTSMFYNKTNFYHVNIALIDECFKSIETVKVKPVERKLGNIYFLEWSGSRKRPKASECSHENVFIAEKGSFYVCYRTELDEQPFFRKKIGSRGTRVLYR